MLYAPLDNRLRIGFLSLLHKDGWCRRLFMMGFLIMNYSFAPAQKVFDVDLWPQGLPNTNGIEQKGYSDSLYNYKPSIRVFLPAGKRAVRAVVICPGGGYSHLALEYEGYAWAPFFNLQGMAAIVLKYRMPNGNRNVPVSDAMEALRQVRIHAKAWNILSDSIGIMGFSAGGHLASTVATHPADTLLRPAFQILLYPVISMNSSLTHRGTHDHLLGRENSQELEQTYSNEQQVTDVTPKAFIAYAQDDKGVKPLNSVLYYEALLRHHVPAVIHAFPSGGHGFGMKKSFAYQKLLLEELAAWLKCL